MIEVEPIYQEQVAAIMGCSTVTVSRRQRDPTDPLPMVSGGKGRGNRAQYDCEEFGRWLRREWTGAKDDLDLDRERALNLQADTALKRLKEQQLLGELAPINALEWALSSVCAQVGAILETLPAKLKRRLPQLSAADLEIVRKEIAKARNTAAAVRIDFGDGDKEAIASADSASDGDHSPANAAQTVRVGG